MEDPRVRIFLDDQPEPFVDEPLPASIKLDTTRLADGPHRLIMRARAHNGREGYDEIPFSVHNGPGAVVSGLRPNSTRRGEIRFTVDAFSGDDPFDPRDAEARSAIPVWVWVMTLFIVAWTVWYTARMWEVPPEFAHTSTYATPSPASIAKKVD